LINEVASEHHVDFIDKGKVEDPIRGHCCEPGLGLFKGFTFRSLYEGFSVLQIARRQCPFSITGLDGSTAQKEPVAEFRYATDNDSWILIMDGLAGVTHKPRPVIARWNS
jgi:hypothetical protein